jgi:CBS domain-containing protein
MQSATVKDFMATDLVTVTPETDIHRAVKILLERRISGAPVIDERGDLVGVLSKKDCLKVAFSAGYHQEWGGKVSEYMSRPVQTVEADADIVEVAELFLKSQYRRFPVMANNRLVGQISRHDILLALEELW